MLGNDGDLDKYNGVGGIDHSDIGADRDVVETPRPKAVLEVLRDAALGTGVILPEVISGVDLLHVLGDDHGGDDDGIGDVCNDLDDLDDVRDKTSGDTEVDVRLAARGVLPNSEEVPILGTLLCDDDLRLGV